MHGADEHRYRDIRYRRPGASGQPLSPISLGLWHNFGVSSPIDDARTMVRRAFDLGVTSTRPGRDCSPAWAVACPTGDRLGAARPACHLRALAGVRSVVQLEESLISWSCLEFSEEELVEIGGCVRRRVAVGVVDGLH